MQWQDLAGCFHTAPAWETLPAWWAWWSRHGKLWPLPCTWRRPPFIPTTPLAWALHTLGPGADYEEDKDKELEDEEENYSGVGAAPPPECLCDSLKCIKAQAACDRPTNRVKIFDIPDMSFVGALEVMLCHNHNYGITVTTAGTFITTITSLTSFTRMAIFTSFTH